MTTFRTTVRRVPGSREIVLVGGGDPFLTTSPGRAAALYPEGADIRTLARRTAVELRSQGVPRVRLSYDDSYFSGPSVNPAWPDDYVPDGVVPPIGALWVDQGRSSSGFGYVEDPAADAAGDFADALRSSGIRVRPRVVRSVSPPTAEEVAAVSSAQLGEIVERTLEVSDNQAAEVLTRHVGLAERQQGSFTAGAAAVLDVLAGLGVPVDGTRLYDGSGLSRRNVVRPAALTGVLELAASEEHPDLRQVLTGLPVAGFTGSLQLRFDRGPDEARGRVRAKTGTLTGVHGLAGVAEDVGGGRMAFAVIADRVALRKTLDARLLIDRIAGRLAACRCGVGSAP
jgi:serine-type D-Ala-D-Ala carboxypeptidase/endopeptidase (penicillin-binding protein 4)